VNEKHFSGLFFSKIPKFGQFFPVNPTIMTGNPGFLASEWHPQNISDQILHLVKHA